jgi:hypothetical protein
MPLTSGRGSKIDTYLGRRLVNFELPRLAFELFEAFTQAAIE